MHVLTALCPTLPGLQATPEMGNAEANKAIGAALDPPFHVPLMFAR